MSRSKLFSFILLALLGSLAAGDPTDVTPEAKPTSPFAITALNKYERVEQKARQDYAHVMAAAEKQLDADLNVALRQAVASGDLDEGTRINAARKESATRLKDDQDLSVAAPTRGAVITIISARYGTAIEGMDVTKVLRTLVKGNTLDVPGKFHQIVKKDPAPGVLKSIVAVVDIGGRPARLTWQDTDLPFRLELAPIEKR